MGLGATRSATASKLLSYPGSHRSFPLNAPSSTCACLAGPRKLTTSDAFAHPVRRFSGVSAAGASFGSSGAKFNSRSRLITSGGSRGILSARSVTSNVREASWRNTASTYGFAPAVSTRRTL